ncbi:MAG: Ig-like domain-containing protein [Armatimonadetes bacterium]|nr:Ig-like domain-containing protein [Armatimonadota bacterium]
MFIPTDSGNKMLLFGATEDDFTPIITPLAHGRTWVVAELDSSDVTQENIMRALKNGRYWSYRSLLPHTGIEPVLHLATSTNGEGKPVIQVTSDILLNDIAFVYRKKDVGIDVRHNWGPRSSAEFTCQGDEIFVRVEASVADIKVYSQPIAVVWEWTSGGGGGSLLKAGSDAQLLAVPSDLVLACALPDQLPDKSPPLGYIGRAYFASTTSGNYPPDATLTLSYEGQDVTPYGTSNLALYRWDDAADAWMKLTSTIDIGNALVTAPLTQAGLCTISAEVIGDTTAPTVTIHTPSNGAALTGPDVVGVQANDNVGVLRASFYLGDQCIGVDSTGYDGYTCDFDFGKKSAGQYTLKVVAEDVSGNTGEADITINISSSGVTPTIAITFPTNGAALEGTAAVTGTCGDDSLVVGVFVAVDGMPVGEAALRPFDELRVAQGGGQEWSYDLDTTKLADGPHTLSAVVMDDNQNTSEQGIGITVTGLTFPTLSAAKSLADGAQARLSGRVVTFGNPGTEGAFYIEEQNRSSGIRVEGSRLPSEGDMVAMSGLMATREGERALVGADVNVLSSSNPIPPAVAMANILLGGGASGSYVPGITGSYGLNNIGLLIRAWGRVTQIGLDYLYIDDGSGLRDGTFTDAEENIGARVACDPTGYDRGDFLVITGISSCFETPSGGIARRILTRRTEDITRLALY